MRQELAGVTAAVLSLEQGYIPPNAGWEALSPKLRLDDWRVTLPTKRISWPTEGLRGVSVKLIRVCYFNLALHRYVRES